MTLFSILEKGMYLLPNLKKDTIEQEVKTLGALIWALSFSA